MDGSLNHIDTLPSPNAIPLLLFLQCIELRYYLFYPLFFYLHKKSANDITKSRPHIMFKKGRRHFNSLFLFILSLSLLLSAINDPFNATERLSVSIALFDPWT